jgi:4-hydroxy-tetrahydrodipicolinate synthase
LSGDDPYAAGYLGQGGDGVISITANIRPEKMAEFVRAWKSKNLERFHALNNELMPLHYAMVTEPNPMPVKAAMEIIGKCSGEVRLPLGGASNKTIEKLKVLLA